MSSEIELDILNYKLSVITLQAFLFIKLSKSSQSINVLMKGKSQQLNLKTIFSLFVILSNISLLQIKKVPKFFRRNLIPSKVTMLLEVGKNFYILSTSKFQDLNRKLELVNQGQTIILLYCMLSLLFQDFYIQSVS